MNSKITNFMIFVTGVAVGSAVTWQYVKKKYEQIAQEEIDSVKEVFSKRDSDIGAQVVEGLKTGLNVERDDVRARAEQIAKKADIMTYAETLHKEGYTNYSNVAASSTDGEEETEPMDMDKPYIITPEDFGEFEEYDNISLTYYADGTLTDEDDEPVEDVDNVVGLDSLNHFGDYEDDSVFVRNNRLKCDYEILLDQRNYSDVIGGKPREVED